MLSNAQTFSLAFGPALAVSAARVFGCIGAQLLVTAEGLLPTPDALAALPEPAARHLIGHLDGEPCELWHWPKDTALAAGLRHGHYRTIWGKAAEAEQLAANRAIQLSAWLAEHRFCGCCGTALVTRDNEPAQACPACGHMAYPRISPVCIVLIRRGDELLLARSPHFPPGVYSALAGFVEAGESLEDCVRREVREEVGLEITNLRWFASQSWPYPHSLMLGFFADYLSGDIRPQPGEIEDAQWFALDTLPPLPHPAALAALMIEAIRAK